MAKTGLEIIRNPATTAGELARLLSAGHPPFEEYLAECTNISCEDCWLAWLVTGEPPAVKPKVQSHGI